MTASTTTHPHIALRELVVGLADPANHYIVKAHSYESEGRTWYLAVLYLHQAVAWNVEMDDDTLTCDILLSRHHPQAKSRIRVSCNQIWSIAAGTNFKCDTEASQLYFCGETRANYPLAAECV